MQLEYFGELFDSRNCFKTCDNCKADRRLMGEDVRDYTAHAKAAVELLQVVGDIRSIRKLPYQVSDEVMESLPHAQAVALLKTLTALEAQTLGRKLLSARILRYNGTEKSYILTLDINHLDLLNGQLQVKFKQPVAKPSSKLPSANIEAPLKRRSPPSLFHPLV